MKNSEHQRFWIRCRYLALFAGIYLVTDTNTHTWKMFLVMKSNSIRIHTIRHENITYPKKLFRIIFRLPFHDFDFFELILENYPIPIAFVWVVWHYPVGTPVLVELFFITVTRFEFFRINWVMFSWQMGGGCSCDTPATHPKLSGTQSTVARVRLEPVLLS